MRRSHMLALSLSRRLLLERFGCSLGAGPLVGTRWDFLAFSVSRRSVFSELLPSSGSSFRLRTSLISPGIVASSFSSSDDRRSTVLEGPTVGPAATAVAGVFAAFILLMIAFVSSSIRMKLASMAMSSGIAILEATALSFSM
ncbi:hypothetical protein F2Q69_00037393 [Brassica cretica]|uniref:Uncharacterized protein n=1 Tax=Brassica cretica TaxID=69181 RepID=A0A8S9SR80_BRACR|nr:hypothetical protein F2Q69_00037393 [Brassica cretica]